MIRSGSRASMPPPPALRPDRLRETATAEEESMAGEALFIGWGAVVRGREKQALQVFQESMEYYG
jgi:hypothetical protein